MSLPFTPEQFLGVFAEYNETFWPVVVAFWLASFSVFVATWRKPADHSRALTYLLVALWVWNTVAYHAWFFTTINPAAWLFGAVFVLQAAFLWTGARTGIKYFSSDGVMARVWREPRRLCARVPLFDDGSRSSISGSADVRCAVSDSHSDNRAPVDRSRWDPPLLAIVPVLWGFIGGSAAVLLDVPTDYVLLAGGALLTFAVLTRRGQDGGQSPRNSRRSQP